MASDNETDLPPPLPPKDPPRTKIKKPRTPRTKPVTRTDSTGLAMRADIERHDEALSKLVGLPEKVDQLIKLLSIPEPDDDDEFSRSENDVDHDAYSAINSLLLKTNENEVEVIEPNDDALMEILNITQPLTDYGPDLNEDVKSSLKRLYVPDNARKLIEKVKDSYKVPQNCQFMAAPKVNVEIWPSLPQKSKQRDLSFQQQQQTITIASVAIAKIAETIFSTKMNMDKGLKQELLRQTMEASSALAMVHDDVNKKRKSEIKTILNPDVAGICSTAITSEGLLFGDNLSEQLKVTRSTSKIVSSSVRGGQLGNRSNRFTPYTRNSLNYYGPSPRGRGAPQRYQRGRPWRNSFRSRMTTQSIFNQSQQSK